MLEKNLIFELHKIEAIKFGSVTLKNGIESPVYFDFRLIISYPTILKQISSQLWKKIAPLRFDLICGVPYTGIPIASTLSILHQIPMVLKRKEAKNYGLKKMVEGSFKPGQTCLLIEDVITTGASIEETIVALEAENLQVSDIALILDREQGGRERLQAKGYKIHSLCTFSNIINILKTEQIIDAETLEFL